MNKKVEAESKLSEVNQQKGHDNSANSVIDRRKALAKIGKFSAYAAPATIASLNSKAAMAS